MIEALSILGLVLLLAILVPLIVWVRRRQKMYGPVIRAGSEAELLAQIADEQKELTRKLDQLIERLDEKDKGRQE